MYAFLSKVFGRSKKDDKDASSSSSSQPILGPGELLGGRFEAISPNVSPAPQFSELDPKTNETKDKEKDVGFSFFKGKWRPASPDVKPTRKLDVLPHLSLNFQEPKAVSTKPDLELLFTTDQILSDAVIGQRRLNPLEALVLVQACSQAILAKGLETLGIMHPHWYAASQSIQRRVISHFIYLSNLEKITSLPSPMSPTSPISAFEAEVNDTFSPHDIAAILRWGLRHVQIEGDSLGTDDGWYKTFLDAESAAGYPPKAFSEKLAPLLPTTHLQLLTATLEIFSSLAAHAEVNGTSGSKLCKIFGLWLLTARRVEDKDDWQTFYARWERTGRMLEHLFLSRIRDESTDQRIPIRLLELVRKYPYTKGLSPPTTDLPLLPRPYFTTRLHDALFVRIETELPYGTRKPNSKQHPLSLLADAFSTEVEEGECAGLWTKIIAASKGGDSPALSNIFTDDTIRFLSLVPEEPVGHEVRSPTFSLISPVSPHKALLSVDDEDKSEVPVAGHSKSATELSPMSLLSPLTNNIGSDWAQFSTSGFLEVSPNIIPLASTLYDTDIEKTIPREPATPPSRKSSKRSKAASPSSPRKSIDLARSGTETSEARPEHVEEQKTIIKASQLQIIQLDDAFIDFWSDSLLDPITAVWPTFIICKFKSSLVPELTFSPAEEGREQKTIQWLVLEQVYTIRAPPVPSIPVETVRPRPSSPGSQSLSVRKRFSFWNRTASSSSDSSHKGKKRDQELKVGELGELLKEPKNETKGQTINVKSPIFKPRKSLDVVQNSIDTMKKFVAKPAEEAKIDEETATVAAAATGVVVASTAAGMTDGLPTLVEVKANVDHPTDTPADEADSKPTAITETVVPSHEPAVNNNDIPISTAHPDVVSSLKAKVETEPCESEVTAVETTAVADEVEADGTYPESQLQPKLTEAEPALLAVEESIIVNGATNTKDSSTPLLSVPEPEVFVEDVEETGGRADTDPISASQPTTAFVVDSEAAEAPVATESIQLEETVSILAQQEPTAAPLISEVASPEPKIETEAPDSMSTTEEPPVVVTSEPETSQGIEVAPAAVDHSPLDELEGTNVENAVSQPEITSKVLESEHIFSPAEETTGDVVTGETSESTIIHIDAEHPHEVAAQEVSQPQSNAILVAEDVLDDREEQQVEVITASTKLEGFGTADDIEANDTAVEEARHDLASAPALHHATSLEPEVEAEASAEPVLVSIDQNVPTSIEIEPESTHSDDPAPVTEASSEIALAPEMTAGVGPQSEPEQDTPMISTTAEEIGISNSKDVSPAVVAEIQTETHEADLPITAPMTANDLIVAKSADTEQPVVLTTEDDSNKHGSEAFVEAVPSILTEDFSSMDKAEPEVACGTVPEAGNDSAERGTTLNIEPQGEHGVDVTAPTTVDPIRDIPISVPLPLEPETIVIKAEVETENQTEADSMTTIEGRPIHAEVQPDHLSVTEIAPNVQKDIEAETGVDDSSNIKDEPILETDIAHHTEVKADTEGPFESVPESSTEESQSTAKPEPEGDFVAPTEEEPLAVTQTEAKNLSPGIENEVAVSQSHDESHIIPEADTVASETQVLGEDALAPTAEEPVASVDLNLRQGAAANMSISSGEPPVHPEPEQPVTSEVEPGPEVVAAVTPESGTFEPQAQPSVEETTEDVDAVIEAPSEIDGEVIAPDIPVVPTLASDIDVAVTSQPPEVLEDELDTANIKPDLHVKTEGPLSVMEGDVVQDSSASSNGSVDVNANTKDETIPNTNLGVDDTTLLNLHGTSAAAELEAPTHSAPETPRVSATPVPEFVHAMEEIKLAQNEGVSDPTTEEDDPIQLLPETKDSIAQDPEEPIDSHAEVEEPAEVASTAELSSAEPTLVVSDPATVAAGAFQTEDHDIAQGKEDSADLPPTHNSAQEDAVTLVESKEVNIPHTAETEPATTVPEERWVENHDIAPGKEVSIDFPPTHNPAQGETVATLVESKEVQDIPHTAETELATVVPEDHQVENHDTVRAEEDLVDSPSTHNPVQEETVAPLVESKEVIDPHIAETETATVLPEEQQVENHDTVQPEEDLVDPPSSTHNPLQEKLVDSHAEAEISSIAEHSAETALVTPQPVTVAHEDFQTEEDDATKADACVVDPPAAVTSEPPAAIPEAFQTENHDIDQPEEDPVDPLPSTHDPVQEKPIDSPVKGEEAAEISSTAELLAAETAPAVSEPATVAPEELPTETHDIAQPEEDSVNPILPSHDPIQEKPVDSHVDAENSAKISPAAELSVAEVTPVISESATVVPEELQTENHDIVQAEDSVDPPLLARNPVQEEPVDSRVEVEEPAEIASTDEPSVAEPVIYKPETVVPEEHESQDHKISQLEEDSVDPLSSTHNPIQEELVESHLEAEEPVKVSSTVESSATETTSVVPEPVTVVHEEHQTENHDIAQAEEDSVDPSLLTQDPIIQENPVDCHVVVEDSVEIFPAAEPSAAEIASVVSEPAAIIPEEIQTERRDITQPEEDSADPPPSTDNQEEPEVEEPVESSSTAEPSVAQMASVIPDPSTEIPEDLCEVAQAQADLVDLPPQQTAETDERTEEQRGTPIPNVEDMVISPLSKVKIQSFDEAEVEVPAAHANGNGHTTTQETIGTLDEQGIEATSENLATEDNIKAELKVIEPHHRISPAPLELEAPSTTD